MSISQSGDFQMFLLSSPKLGKIPILTSICFNWVGEKPPTSFPGCILDPGYPGGSCIFINPILYYPIPFYKMPTDFKFVVTSNDLP